MIVLDLSITITALPSIRDDLDFSPAAHHAERLAATGTPVLSVERPDRGPDTR